MNKPAEKGFFIAVFVVLSIAMSCFDAACKSSGQNPEKKGSPDEAAAGHDHASATAVESRIASLKSYQIDPLYQKSRGHCGKDTSCYQTALLNIVGIHGPKTSIELMSVLKEQGRRSQGDSPNLCAI